MIKKYCDIDAGLDFKVLVEKLKIQQDSPEYDEFSELFSKALSVARPKALLKKAAITGRGVDSLCVAGAEFHCRMLSTKSANSDFILLFAVTCGSELDRIKIDGDDFLAAYWLDIIKEECMKQAFEYIQKQARETCNYSRAVSLCPSDSGSWPLHELKQVFANLEPDAAEIGMGLSEYCFMSPNKSLCGALLDIQDQSEVCQICDFRDKCEQKDCAG